MNIENISMGEDAPWDVNVIVEVPAGGSPVKYEMDKDSGALFVDRVIHTPMRYPCSYGFVPHTLSDDGDPIDVLVASDVPFMAGSVVRVRPVGVLKMKDEKGEDEKVVAVPVSKVHPFFDKVKDYSDLPDILQQQIKHFFEHYKDLEAGKWVKVEGWGDANEAAKMIEDAIDRAKAKAA